MAKSQKEKSVTKDRLVGMTVIDSEGNIVGTVKDVGFTVGKAGISLSVEDKDGDIRDCRLGQHPRSRRLRASEAIRNSTFICSATSASCSASCATNSAAVPNMWAPANICPTVSKMVLLQRQKICLILQLQPSLFFFFHISSSEQWQCL